MYLHKVTVVNLQELFDEYILPKDIIDKFDKITEQKRFLLVAEGTLYQKIIRINGKNYGPYWYRKDRNGKDTYIGKQLPDYILEQRKNIGTLKFIEELEKQYDKILALWQQLMREVRSFRERVENFEIKKKEVKE